MQRFSWVVFFNNAGPKRYGGRVLFAAVLIALVLGLSQSAVAQSVPPPVTPDPLYPQILYGSDPATSAALALPVIVFVPGLGGNATDWLPPNNSMYLAAYSFGYRTAFVTPDDDNVANSDTVQEAAEMLKTLVPVIATHYGVDQVYMVGHSKGGVDIQVAMMDAGFASQVSAVFTISSPNNGTELADWAFENPDISGPLNLLTPAVDSLRTINMEPLRATMDPILEGLQIPIFHHGGTRFADNPLTLITGAILRGLVPGDELDAKNDGFVTIGRTRLSQEYGINLGTVASNHFETDSGAVSMPKITGRIQGIENTINEFERIAHNGFAKLGGDDSNTWAWSMGWFQGKLYVGTGREPDCVTLLTADIGAGTSYYQPAVLSGKCPSVPELAVSLAAEIWQYDPGSGAWQRVYQSPQDVPVMVEGQPVMTARDMGYRGMAVHEEPDGTEALYIGGVTSGSIFDPNPSGTDTYPGPRLLRSVDGVTWAEVPAAPGTFLGEIGNAFLSPDTKVRSFRSLKSYNGRLFATAGGFVGSGFIVASDDPAAGNDDWYQASPAWSDLPVWTLEVFNNQLYATTGFASVENPNGDGYGVYRTDASGSAPFTFVPVVTQGGNQTDPVLRGSNGLSLAVYNGQLYVGTNRPTELIRVNADDTWDLIVGEPRMTPSGMKAPLSGFGIGFASWFNGHFWRMASHEGKLFLGTWDWSNALQDIPILELFDRAFSSQGGFDLFRTEDGVEWTAVTQIGMGDIGNSGVRSMISTPASLFLGTVRHRAGLQAFQYVGPPANPIATPQHLRSVSEVLAGRNVQLTWNPVPGASRYLVYQARGKFLDELLDEIFPNGTAGLCEGQDPAACDVLETLQEENGSPVQFPLSYRVVDQVTTTFWSKPAPTTAQSIYFVKAIDSQGRPSDSSNIVGGPSKALPEEFGVCDVDDDEDVDSNDIAIIATSRGATPIGPEDPRDANKDGAINVVDSRACALQCTRPRCAQ